MTEKSLFDSDCDVLVFGGGAAGFSCACSAASRGLRTVLIEPRGSLLWEISWARQQVELKPQNSTILTQFQNCLNDAGAVKAGFIEPVIGQLAADRFCVQNNVRLIFEGRPLRIKPMEDGRLQISIAFKGQVRTLITRSCIDCSDNGYLVRKYGANTEPQPVDYYFWALTFSKCHIQNRTEVNLSLGSLDIPVRARPSAWDDEIVVDIAYPDHQSSGREPELIFNSDIEPIVMKLRHLIPALQHGILAHISDEPWHMPPISVSDHGETCVWVGPNEKVAGVGYWMETFHSQIHTFPLWAQSNQAINQALLQGDLTAQQVIGRLSV